MVAWQQQNQGGELDVLECLGRLCMEVSWNGATPESSISTGFFYYKPSRNQGCPILGNPHIFFFAKLSRESGAKCLAYLSCLVALGLDRSGFAFNLVDSRQSGTKKPRAKQPLNHTLNHTMLTVYYPMGVDMGPISIHIPTIPSYPQLPNSPGLSKWACTSFRTQVRQWWNCQGDLPHRSEL